MDQNQAQIPHNEAQKPTRSVSLDSLVSNHFGCRLTRTNIRFLRLYLSLQNFCREGQMLKSKRIISHGLLCLLITACMTVSAKADTTYTYTGPAFNFFYGAVCPPNCNITGSFTLATPLAINDNMVELPTGTPFSFSSGPYTATQANVTSPSASVQISTNAAGMIDLWDIDLFDFSDEFDIFTADQGMAGASYDQFGKLEPNPPFGYKSAGDQILALQGHEPRSRTPVRLRVLCASCSPKTISSISGSPRACSKNAAITWWWRATGAKLSKPSKNRLLIWS